MESMTDIFFASFQLERKLVTVADVSRPHY